MPKNAMEATWQYMEQEAADELLRRERQLTHCRSSTIAAVVPW